MSCTRTYSVGLMLGLLYAFLSLASAPSLAHAIPPQPASAASIPQGVTTGQSLTSPIMVGGAPASGIDIPLATAISPSPKGVKSWLIKQALELVATGIRKGGRVVQELISYMDASAARAFRKHSGAIADALDDIAQIPALSRRVVKDKLRYFLTNTLQLDHGTAQVIVTAVDGVLAILA